MDDDSLLPAKSDVLHIWNPRTQKMDVLDLTTGRMHEPQNLSVSAFAYTLQVVDVICAHLREGKTLTQICQMENMPNQHRIYAWLSLYPEFKARYKDARKQRGDYHADKVLDIAEKAMYANKDMIPGYKLAADIHRWAAEKADPESYGPPKDTSKGGGNSVNITLHTGVLDSTAPADIIVDVHGNFKGFNNGTQVAVDSSESGSMGEGGSTIELSRDRFRTIESNRDDDQDEGSGSQEDS